MASNTPTAEEACGASAPPGAKLTVAFFHDHRFRRDPEGRYYTIGNLPYPVLQRYLTHFDRLVVVGRVQDVPPAPALAVSSGEGVSFAPLPPGASHPARLGAPLRRHVRQVLAEADCAIVRMPSLVGVVACREAERMGKPWLVEVVGSAWDSLWNHGSVKGALAALPMSLLTRRALRHAPLALYVSEEYLQRTYPCRGETIACSDVAIPPPDPEVLRSRLERHPAGRSGTFSLGLVGSLDVNYKGHDTALQALALLRDRHPELRLRFLGGGDPARWRVRAERLGVLPLVVFDGVRPAGGPVLKWMDDLDVLLMPSRQEGLPRALVEALSRACPAVASRVGGVPELLPERWIFPIGDHRALADRVRQLAEDPAAWRASAEEAFRTAARFAPDRLDARRRDFLARLRARASERLRGAVSPVAAPQR